MLTMNGLKSFFITIFFIILHTAALASEPGAFLIPTGVPELHTGDIIFHVSSSNQAKAIQEAQKQKPDEDQKETRSNLTHVGVIIEHSIQNGIPSYSVYEAIGAGVVATPLRDFINRGVDKEYIIKRVKQDLFTSAQIAEFSKKLLDSLRKNNNREYDYLFEWSDKKIYCSELVYKGYLNAFGVETGTVQTLGDLNLDGPAVKKLIIEREKRFGTKKNLEEPIVTPFSVYQSKNLDLVFDSSTFQQK